MSNFYNRQQQNRNSLILGFLLSLFIHGAIALILARYEAQELVATEKEQPITSIEIVELDEKPNTKIPSKESTSNLPPKSDRVPVAASQASLETSASPKTPANPPPKV